MTARSATPFSPERLAEALARLGSASSLVIALSGGADSAAVLAAAVALRPRYLVRAIHVDHAQPGSPRLRAAAEAAAAACAVPLTVVTVAVTEVAALGFEAAARRVRYAALGDSLQNGEDLVTAHHQDDQAETLLLQLFRGTGIRGLAAMPTVAPLGAGRLLRPVLAFPRAALREYAEHARLPWVEDPSNDDLGIDRNYLRQAVWPLLAVRWPGLAETVARAAGHLGETLDLLDAELAPRLAAAQTGDGLQLARLAELSSEWRREVIRYWLRGRGLPVPSSRQLAQFDAQFLSAAPDRQPILACGEFELRRHDGCLVVVPPALPSLSFDAQAMLPDGGTVDLPGLGRLTVEAVGEGGLRCRQGHRYRLATRLGGERWCRDLGGPQRPLKDWLREARIAPWVRQRAVLVWDDETLAAVILPDATWVGAAYRTVRGEAGLAVRWVDAPAALRACTSH
jgi:tRNA(Ile)-lysidine synthase